MIRARGARRDQEARIMREAQPDREREAREELETKIKKLRSKIDASESLNDIRKLNFKLRGLISKLNKMDQVVKARKEQRGRERDRIATRARKAQEAQEAREAQEAQAAQEARDEEEQQRLAKQEAADEELRKRQHQKDVKGREENVDNTLRESRSCLLYTSPSPRDRG